MLSLPFRNTALNLSFRFLPEITGTSAIILLRTQILASFDRQNMSPCIECPSLNEDRCLATIAHSRPNVMKVSSLISPSAEVMSMSSGKADEASSAVSKPAPTETASFDCGINSVQSMCTQSSEPLQALGLRAPIVVESPGGLAGTPSIAPQLSTPRLKTKKDTTSRTNLVAACRKIAPSVASIPGTMCDSPDEAKKRRPPVQQSLSAIHPTQDLLVSPSSTNKTTIPVQLPTIDCQKGQEPYARHPLPSQGAIPIPIRPTSSRLYFGSKDVLHLRGDEVSCVSDTSKRGGQQPTTVRNIASSESCKDYKRRRTAEASRRFRKARSMKHQEAIAKISTLEERIANLQRDNNNLTQRAQAAEATLWARTGACWISNISNSPSQADR